MLPLSLAYLVDHVLREGHTARLPSLVLLVAGAVTLQIGSAYAARVLSIAAATATISDLRRKVHAHTLSLPVSFFDHQRVGTTVSIITRDVDSVEFLVGMAGIELAGAALTSICALLAMTQINGTLAAAATLYFAVLMLVAAGTLLVLAPRHWQLAESYARMTARLTESFAGIRVVKAFAAEDHEGRAFAVDEQATSTLNARVGRNAAAAAAGGSAAFGCAAVCIYALGAHRVAAHAITLGQLVAFVGLLGFLVAPLTHLLGSGPDLIRSLTALDRLHRLLRQAPEADGHRRAAKLEHVRGAVTFDGVSFAYPGGPEVLHDVSFQIRAGDTVAVVGPSGSGKTTILALLAAFHAPTRGCILIDGINLETIELQSYRRALGLVTQDAFLFDGTLGDNVRAFSAPGLRIDDACRAARVEDFAVTLPEKYDTLVGENGVRLSAGQRQRIAIARALLAAPQILLLDEPTANLDSQSEVLVRSGIANLIGCRTTFIVSHRLALVRDADKILVLREGTLVEQGTHGSLMGIADGTYRSMYETSSALERSGGDHGAAGSSQPPNIAAARHG